VHTWFVQPCVEKPEFWIVISFLWGDLHNVDTDGDSDNPASRSWTWLYVQNREAPSEIVEIDEVEGSRCVRVCSTTSWLAAAVAFFLAREGCVSVSRDGHEWANCDLLRSDAGYFDLEAGLARANASILRRATPSDP
jgi:hypothetical protein